MEFERFLVSVDDHVAHVRINRPDKMNALDGIGWQELKQVFETLDKMEEVRVIVVSGEGRAFCAGADLHFLMEGPAKAADESPGHAREKLYHGIVEFQSQVSAAEVCRKPVLGAIHGACVGGALDMITAFDMRYSTKDAFFAIAEIDLGIVADIGTLQRLPKLIPDGIVRELTYTGRRFYAAEAKEMGLLNNVYEDKDEMLVGVMEIAQTIAAKSPLTVRGAKETIKFTRDNSVADGLRQVATWNAGMLLSEDLTEAMTAYMQKRKPEFKK
ncbi:MAG: crotonase/enoyl-CoA hydratase family protein [Anaerolineae bacterium]